MIEVENVVSWSAAERSTNPEPAVGEIDVVAADLGRAIRFYSRVFGLRPARGACDDGLAIVPVTAQAKLVIHDAAVRPRARCVRRWAFVVTDLEHVREQVWELGVKVARDSGAPDHIYRWSNGRSLYIHAPDDHEIELTEFHWPRVGQAVRRAPDAVARSAAGKQSRARRPLDDRSGTRVDSIRPIPVFAG